MEKSHENKQSKEREETRQEERHAVSFEMILEWVCQNYSIKLR